MKERRGEEGLERDSSTRVRWYHNRTGGEKNEPDRVDGKNREPNTEDGVVPVSEKGGS